MSSVGITGKASGLELLIFEATVARVTIGGISQIESPVPTHLGDLPDNPLHLQLCPATRQIARVVGNKQLITRATIRRDTKLQNR